MTRPGYAQLEDVIRDPEFPELDLALRRGRHIDRDDVAWYALLGDAQGHLEAFYRRYGCELVHKADGYYYLLPTGDKLSRRQLSAGDMLVGQALALLYLHPSTVERGGLHTQEELIAQLATVLGSDALIRAFNPKRRRYDERVAQKTVRARVGEAVRRLAGLGFVDLAEGDQLRLRPALLRFAEPVRGLSEPAEALAQLVARGEVALDTDGAAGAARGTAEEGDGEEDDSDGDGDGGDGEEDAGAGLDAHTEVGHRRDAAAVGADGDAGAAARHGADDDADSYELEYEAAGGGAGEGGDEDDDVEEQTVVGRPRDVASGGRPRRDSASGGDRDPASGSGSSGSIRLDAASGPSDSAREAVSGRRRGTSQAPAPAGASDAPAVVGRRREIAILIENDDDEPEEQTVVGHRREPPAGVDELDAQTEVGHRRDIAGGTGPGRLLALDFGDDDEDDDGGGDAPP
jgi:chromosome partition protein MukE